LAEIKQRRKDLPKLEKYNTNAVAGHLQIEIDNLNRYKSERQDPQVLKRQKSLVEAIRDIVDDKSFR
jgi:hypothetical protein